MPGEIGASVLDVAFLVRQTFGDRELEREVLALFDAQCVRLLPIIVGDGESRIRADAAHTLTGAASAVGAEAVAAAASAIEAKLVGGTAVPERRAGETFSGEPRAHPHGPHAEVAGPRSTSYRRASFEADLRPAPQDEEVSDPKETFRPSVEEDRLAGAVEAARRAVAARLHAA